MGNSLREQLLKAGLVNQQQVSKANKAQWNKKKKQRKNKADLPDLEKAYALKAQEDKAQRDKEISQKRKEKAQRRETAAQIKQLIEKNRISREGGEIPYNFTVNKKIKKLHVTAELLSKLNTGKLAIVSLGGSHEIVPSDIAEKISQRDARRVIPTITASTSAPATADDPYADYQIPDDLMW